MNPKKANEIFKTVVQEQSLDPNLVQDLTNFYWSEVRRAITDIPYPRININNLGIFEIRKIPLENTIKRYERFRNKIPVNEFKKYTLYSKISDRIAVLENAKYLMEQGANKKQEIKSLRNEQSNQNLETQGSDSRGDQEQSV